MSHVPIHAARSATLSRVSLWASTRTGFLRKYGMVRRPARARSAREIDARGLRHLAEVVDDGVDEVPQVGHEIATRDEAEVERVEVALHGDVEPLPVDDRRHRVVVQ